MPGFGGFLEVLVSSSVEIGGGGLIHGGKGIMMAGARKIGWAGKGGPSRQGRRFAGHRLASKRMASSGVAGMAGGRLGRYDPKQAYKSQTQGPYHQAMKCGSGVVKFGRPKKSTPDSLFGRPGFSKPSGPLGREVGERYCRKRQTRPATYSKNPRAHIKFK